MAFREFDEPRAVSYVDIGQFAILKGWISTEGLPSQEQVEQLPRELINEALFSLGVDLSKEVEENVVLHRPNYLAHFSNKEDKPKVEGLCFFGYERKDNDWKEFKRKYKI